MDADRIDYIERLIAGVREQVKKFHPNDWMGMPCFVNRDIGKPSDLAL